MKNKFIVCLISFVVILSGCTSTTMIQSIPSEAKLYINNEPVGFTPYTYRDSKIAGSNVSIKIEKEGYQPFYSSFARDEEYNACAIIGGFVCFFPIFWAMDYKPAHTYELTPYENYKNEITEPEFQPSDSKSKYEKLRELKSLLDEGVLTQEEFDKEKAKILEQ